MRKRFKTIDYVMMLAVAANIIIFCMPNANSDTKVSALTVDTTPYGTDYLYAVKNPGTTPLSRAVTMTNGVKAGLAIATNVGIGTTTATTTLQVGVGARTAGPTAAATDSLFKDSVQVDGTIYNPGIIVTSGNYVCFGTTSKQFYVKSSCP